MNLVWTEPQPGYSSPGTYSQSVTISDARMSLDADVLDEAAKHLITKVLGVATL